MHRLGIHMSDDGAEAYYYAWRVVAALLGCDMYLVGDTIGDWLEIPRTPWDTAAKAVPVVLGLLETIEDSSPYAEWALDKAGSLLSGLELSALTRAG